MPMPTNGIAYPRPRLHRRDPDDTHDTRYHTREDIDPVISRIDPGEPLDPGDLLIGGEAGTPTRLPPGTPRQVFTVVNGVPGWKDKSVFDVQDYDHLVVSGDWTPALRAVADDVAANGGGQIVLPGPYDYTLLSSTNTAGLQWQWVIYSDNTSIVFEKGARLVSAVAHTRPLMFLGSAKPSGVASWATHEPTDATVYALSGSYGKGVASLTLATPADAANFAAGDVIFIRTGQTLAGSGQPDSELNVVVSGDGTTGVVVLRYPTTKPYQQEYFVSGTSGVTSTSVTANAAPYGIAKVSDRILRNVSVENMDVVTSGLCFQAFSLWDVMDAQIRGGTLTYTRAGFGSRNSRFVSVSDLDFEHVGVDANGYGLHPSTGCTNWNGVNIDIRSQAWSSLQLHEGTADCQFSNFRVAVADAPSTLSALAVRARAYDNKFSTFEITGKWQSTANAVIVDSTCTGGGSFVNGVVHGGSVRIDAPHWTGVENLRVTGGNYALRAAQLGYGHQMQQMVFSGVVLHTQQTVMLGTLPLSAVVTGVSCYVETAFTSDGTDQITVGGDVAPSRYATAIDVSSTGVKTVTLGTQVGIPNNTPELPVKAFYSNGGTEPGAGIAHIAVHYYIGARKD